MEYVLIVFGSRTTASKVSLELERKFKINSTVMQTPKKIPLKSCSYSIKAEKNHLKQIIQFLKDMNVYIRGVYDFDDYSKIV